VLFVADSCEEGLGNLKGCKAIMHAYGSRVKAFLSLDGDVTHVCAQAVGSARYRITARTKGGHSFADFGNRNAIAVLAGIACALYRQRLPEYLGSTTTYNVGTMQGGTSVNTIAQEAEMLYEYRSNDRAALEIMRKHFEAAIDFYRAKGIEVTVTMVGNRPCSGEVDEEKHQALKERAMAAIKNNYDLDARLASGSTDCNIPLSMGIPSVCVGCVRGGKAHTREEYVELDSLEPGYRTAFELILHHF
jgi:acetylornithine deacetylase/succinyl-diaminopimelate desuccinylase-like protein